MVLSKHASPTAEIDNSHKIFSCTVLCKRKCGRRRDKYNLGDIKMYANLVARKVLK
jgi:hypothetical protein